AWWRRCGVRVGFCEVGVRMLRSTTAPRAGLQKAGCGMFESVLVLTPHPWAWAGENPSVSERLRMPLWPEILACLRTVRGLVGCATRDDALAVHGDGHPVSPAA